MRLSNSQKDFLRQESFWFYFNYFLPDFVLLTGMQCAAKRYTDERIATQGTIP